MEVQFVNADRNEFVLGLIFSLKKLTPSVTLVLETIYKFTIILTKGWNISNLSVINMNEDSNCQIIYTSSINKEKSLSILTSWSVEKFFAVFNSIEVFQNSWNVPVCQG